MTMAAYAPEAYFRFAADQISLLRDIYYRLEGLAESELRQLIARLRKPDMPVSAYIFRQLREMDMVEEMPGQTAFFELTAPWKEISLYVPANIRELVRRYGKPELLQNSSAIFSGLRSAQDEDVARVFQCLEEFGLGLEQEVLWANTNG